MSERQYVWDPENLHYEFPLPNRDLRFKELVIYISRQLRTDRRNSLVKLYKILFYSDLETFGRHGTPITGVRYRRRPFGPAPADFMRMQEEMLRDREIQVVREDVFDFARQLVLPLKEPDVDLFLGREISIVERWIRFFWNKPAKEVSLFSHRRPWTIAREDELIPYESVFISNDPVTFEDVARVKELAARYGWTL